MLNSVEVRNQLKNGIINRGIESCKKDKNLELHEIEGSIEGFNLCRNINTQNEFIDVIRKRREEEIKMVTSDFNKEEIKNYWKFHYTTIQIEFVYNRMVFMWQLIDAQASVEKA